MRPCLWNGCPELVEDGYCTAHKRQRNKTKMQAPYRWVYDDPRWPHTRRRAGERAGWRCEVVEHGGRCVVEGRNLHGMHVPLSVLELMERGLDPFDPRHVRMGCASHHGRIDALLR